MKRLIVAIGVIVLTTATMADAQQPATPADPHHPPGQTQTPAPSVQPAPTPAPPAGGMMPMMDMCREMMSGHPGMGPGMMGGRSAHGSQYDVANDGDARRVQAEG
jgi:hypothetical protein